MQTPMVSISQGELGALLCWTVYPSSPSPHADEGETLGSALRKGTQGKVLWAQVRAEGLAAGGCPPRGYNQVCPPQGQWASQPGPQVQLPSSRESGAHVPVIPRDGATWLVFRNRPLHIRATKLTGVGKGRPLTRSMGPFSLDEKHTQFSLAQSLYCLEADAIL